MSLFNKIQKYRIIQSDHFINNSEPLSYLICTAIGVTGFFNIVAGLCVFLLIFLPEAVSFFLYLKNGAKKKKSYCFDILPKFFSIAKNDSSFFKALEKRKGKFIVHSSIPHSLRKDNLFTIFYQNENLYFYYSNENDDSIVKVFFNMTTIKLEFSSLSSKAKSFLIIGYEDLEKPEYKFILTSFMEAAFEVKEMIDSHVPYNNLLSQAKVLSSLNERVKKQSIDQALSLFPLETQSELKKVIEEKEKTLSVK